MFQILFIDTQIAPPRFGWPSPPVSVAPAAGNIRGPAALFHSTTIKIRVPAAPGQDQGLEGLSL